MARTQGHGNPNWTRDETILALDLYFKLDRVIPSGIDKRLQELSELLRNLPYHAAASKNESFRNISGVTFKLLNLQQVAIGKGLGNVSKIDRQIWQEFGAQPSKTKKLANLIREGISASLSIESSIEEPEFVEGRIITELHSRRERNSKLRERLLLSRRKTSKLFCEMCGTLPLSENLSVQDAQFEAHHIVPLSNEGIRTTRLSDMALLCANCHRLLHRAIAVEKRWLNIKEAKEVCGLPT